MRTSPPIFCLVEREDCVFCTPLQSARQSVFQSVPVAMVRPAIDGSGFDAERDALPIDGARIQSWIQCRARLRTQVSNPTFLLVARCRPHRTRWLPSTGEPESQFIAVLAIWERIEIEDLPAWFHWQRGAFELLRENFSEVRQLDTAA